MKKILSIIMIVSIVVSGLITGQLLFSTLTIAPGTDMPDLTLLPQNITISPATPKVGEPVSIYATIWNVGTADATNITVNFYEEDILISSENVNIPVNGTWTNYRLDSVGNVGGDSSIAVDDTKGIHISYRDGTNLDLKYAYKPSGGSWTTYTVDSIDDVGKHTSIAVDSTNGIHISYLDVTNYDLKYAHKPSGGSWTTYTVDSISDVGAVSSIAVDSLNGIHISYLDVTNYDLKYAYKPSGGSWINYTVDSFGNVGIRTSIAVDNTNGVHISYHNITNETATTLKYAYKPSGGSWNFYTIDTIGENVNLATSIAVDGVDGVHISYFEETNDDLKYAYKPSGGSWTTYTTDSSGAVGSWNSIAVDSMDGVHISYRDWSNRDLKYAFKPSGGNWTTHYIDSPGDVGMATSIAVDDSNGIHISYLDWEDRDLKYATQITPSGNIEVQLSWTPTKPGLRNITVKIDENNEIEELDETNNEATVSINVELGPLSTIEVAPQSVTLELNVTQQFTATGYDAYGNEVPISPTWDVNGGGTIDQDGLFTTIYPGTWLVSASQSNNTGIATVIIQVNETADTDSDGILDWWEVEYGLDPFNESDANLDPDLDYLTNLQEFLNGTKPFNNESDGDNLGDGFEVIFSKTKPNDWDTNDNGIGDGLEFIHDKGYLGWIQSLPNDWIGMVISWENYTIFIKTNSSVLEGEFDKDERKLAIKVSGPEGTLGVTEMEVPKSLCDSEDIEIKLDGELINYTLTEDDTYYYIHIEYNHSVHELAASFGYVTEVPSEPTDDEKSLLENIYLIALIIAIIIIDLLLILVIIIRSEKMAIGEQEISPEKLLMILENKYKEGSMSDETYNDIKSLLDKYNGG